MALAPRFRYRRRRGKEGEFYPNRLREQRKISVVRLNVEQFSGLNSVTHGAVLQTLVLPAKKRR
jgi:hypothetical protein